ncbi:hypothetical protein V6N13_030093 [Hibiscus sabdariffa]
MVFGLRSVSTGTRGGGGREWLTISGETTLSFRFGTTGWKIESRVVGGGFGGNGIICPSKFKGVDGSIGDDVDDIGDDLGPDNNDGDCRFGTICWNIESCVVGGGGGVGDNGII